MRHNDADLTRHLRSFGPLLPVFTHNGTVIDGRRRGEICRAHKVPIKTFELKRPHVLPLVWMLNPERITREQYRDAVKPPVAAAHDVWSDPGTIAAFWLQEEPRETYRWRRLHTAIEQLLTRASEGRVELTTSAVLDVVRKNL